MFSKNPRGSDGSYVSKSCPCIRETAKKEEMIIVEEFTCVINVINKNFECEISNYNKYIDIAEDKSY